nr:hypothetical protein [Thiomicrorhabdus sp.]
MNTNFENGIQITEEQENLIITTVEVCGGDTGLQIDNPIETAIAFSKSLSTEQLKQLCEAKGLSVVEWIDFDGGDESTWPIDDKSYYVKGKNILDDSREKSLIANFYTFGDSELIKKYGKKYYWIRPQGDFYADLSFFEVTSY